MSIQILNFKSWQFGTPDSEILSSLIICTYKRPIALVKLIHHLSKIPYLPQEILIIDGSQDNESINIIEPFLSGGLLKRNITYVFAPTGLTIQRNAGIDISRGSIVHFIDDDCLPEPNYFKEIEKVFIENPDIGGVSGAILNEMSGQVSKKYKIRKFLRLFPQDGIPGKYYCNGSSVPKSILGTSIANNYEIDVVSGAAMSFRREIINKIGGFSEFFQGYSQGEDIEFALRARKITKLLLCRKAECYHYNEPISRPDLFKKGFMEIFNRYYIWRLHVPKKTLKCRIQFWGDIFFIITYAILWFMFKGFRFDNLKYCFGLFKGAFKAIATTKVREYKRTIFFNI